MWKLRKVEPADETDTEMTRLCFEFVRSTPSILLLGRQYWFSEGSIYATTGNERRGAAQAGAVTGLLMLIQLVIGYTFNVMSLVAESYHMLNDVAAYVVQLYANELSNLDRGDETESSAFSFGFGRAEFIANLVQGTLLLALCLTLALESLQRAYSTETILMPPLVVGVGLITLLWNIVAFSLFEGAHHVHDEHSLAHPLRYRSKMVQTASNVPVVLSQVIGRHRRARTLSALSLGVSHSHSHTHAHEQESRPRSHSNSNTQSRQARIRTKAKTKQMFLHAPQSSLAIHAFGDALGSVAIIIDGAASWLFGPEDGKLSGVIRSWPGVAFVDPICALVAVYIILSHSFPLVTSSSFALMHAFDPVESGRIRSIFRGRAWLPPQIASLVRVELTELHIWQLSATSSFATVKFALSGHAGSRRSVEVTDLTLIERAAKKVLAHLVPPQNVTIEFDVGTTSAVHERSGY